VDHPAGRQPGSRAGGDPGRTGAAVRLSRRAALRSNGRDNATILLVDCSHDVREARLRAWGQPELATPQMAAWAAYLRGQADALELPVLDTSELTPGVAAHALLERVHALATH
jgi:hypothetical protein